MQNRQLQTWLSEDEYAQVDIEWQEQLELREELKDKPSELTSEAEVADTLRKLREAAELGELDVLIEQQAQFGRRLTQKNT